MKKTISRSDYIHRNKSNITIGIKGKPKQVFSLASLNNQIASVQKQAQELYQKYKHNAKFPLKLGSTSEPVPFISQAYSDIMTINASMQGFLDPAEVAREFKDLAKVAKNRQYFESKYYKEVNKYYGTRYNIAETKGLLKRRGFKILRSEVRRGYYRKTLSDPVRLQDWIIANIKGANDEKIRNITNVDELNLIVQRWEITGDIPANLKRPPARSRKK